MSPVRERARLFKSHGRSLRELAKEKEGLAGEDRRDFCASDRGHKEVRQTQGFERGSWCPS